MKLTRIVAAAGLLAATGIGGIAVAGPAAAYPINVAATATINSTVFGPGGQFTINVKNATPGSTLTGVFESTPVPLAGSATVQKDTTAVFVSNIPANATAGQHKIIINSTAGAAESFTFNVTVLGTNGGGGGKGSGGLADTGAAVTGIGILGGVLVAGGVFFVVAGRRRSANQTPSV